MKKTSCKLRYILKHGFIAVFAFGISMALGVSGFSQLLNVPSTELNTEVLRLNAGLTADKMSGAMPIYYLFILFAAALLVFILLYIRRVCKAKVKNS